MNTPCIDWSECHAYATNRGRCDAHQKPMFMSTGREEKYPSDWRQQKVLVFQMYGTTCHVCGEDGSDEVDHVDGTDNHHISNLRPIHGKVLKPSETDSNASSCHQTKTAYEGINSQRRSRAMEYGTSLTQQYYERLKDNN